MISLPLYGTGFFCTYSGACSPTSTSQVHSISFKPLNGTDVLMSHSSLRRREEQNGRRESATSSPRCGMSQGGEPQGAAPRGP